MQGINLAEQGHFVNVLPPQNINGGVLGDRFHLKNHGHASILVQLGVTGAAPGLITVTSFAAASGGTGTALPFNVYKEESAAGDTLSAKVAATATGVQPPATDDIMYVIEIDASALPAGEPWLEVGLANASGNSVLASCSAILSGSRYQGDPANTPSAIV